MKTKYLPAIRLNARETLKSIKLNPDQPFFTLRYWQVQALIEEADRVKYKTPKGACKTRANCFFDKLQREAKY